MKKNMGTLDRILRILFAVVVGLLYWQGIISGTLAIVLATVAAVLTATSFVSFCPIYGVLGLRSIAAKVAGKK